MKHIQLEASVKSTAKGIEVLAYSGGLMTVPGWGPVVIDITGLNASGQIKLLCDHDSTIDGLAGYGTARLSKSEIVIIGKILANTEIGQRLIELSKEGVQFQASVGVEPSEVEYIRAGETIVVNKQTITSNSDFTLIKKGQLREVTICLIGCDSETAVKIAAQQKFNHGVNTMKTLTVGQVKEIRETCGLYANIVPAADLRQIEDSAIEAGWDANQTAKECMAKMDLVTLKASRPKAPAVYTGGNHSGDVDKQQVIEAATLMMCGRQRTAEKHYSARILQAASDMRLTCAVHLCDAALRLYGHDVPSGQGEMIKAAFSTTALSNALANSATKELIEAYNATPATWRSIALRKSAKNFHAHSAIRGVLKNGIYQEVAADGELHHARLDDEATSYKVNTRGLMFGITREDIINDDLGIIFDLQRTLGINSMRTINKLFWETVIGATTFFTTDNGNYAEGAATALGIDSLSAAIQKLREQVDGDGNPVGIVPAVLAVPPALEATARKILLSTELNRTGDKSPTTNPWVNLDLKLEVEPILSKATGGSSKAWYLFGNPDITPAMIVSFLNGVETPTVEESDAPFNQLGRQYRAFLDFGCDTADHRGGVRMKGEI
jgi:hypothetical protein